MAMRSKIRPQESASTAKPPNLLARLTAEQSRSVVAAAERQRVEPGHIIIRAEELANQLFLLTRGTAKYYRVTKQGEQVLLWWLTSGDAFGIGTLLAGPIHYIGTAEAVESCELLKWDRQR